MKPLKTAWGGCYLRRPVSGDYSSLRPDVEVGVWLGDLNLVFELDGNLKRVEHGSETLIRQNRKGSSLHTSLPLHRRAYPIHDNDRHGRTEGQIASEYHP